VLPFEPKMSSSSSTLEHGLCIRLWGQINVYGFWALMFRRRWLLFSHTAYLVKIEDKGREKQEYGRKTWGIYFIAELISTASHHLF